MLRFPFFRQLARLWPTLGLLATPWMIFTAQAQSLPSDSEALLTGQRYHYQKARTALEEKKLDAYREHLAHLDSYPLKPYLEFRELRGRLAEPPFEDIDRFIAQYPDSFLEHRLRANLLTSLAGRERWSDYMRYHQADRHLPPEARCQSLIARIKTGDKRAFDEVAAIWSVGRSQPDACDPLFQLWRSQGGLTQDIIWQRFNDAMARGELRFARYVATLMNESRRAQADRYLQVHNTPSLITRRERFPQKDLPTQHTIAYGIRLLARQQPLEALQHWEMYEAQQLFPDDMIQETKLEIVKRLIRGGHGVQAQALLSQTHSLRNQDVLESLLRDALNELDWPRVADVLRILDPDSRTSDRWRYWAARTQEQLDQPIEHFETAKALYQSLARNRSFYGFLAADKLVQPYALVDEPAPLSQEILDTVAQQPDMQRANELWLTGNVAEARAEWLHSSRRMDETQLLAAGRLAQQWGWYHGGIQAMISGNFWNELTVRFPLAFREEIDRIAQDTQLDVTLIYAIARQESAFNVDARSSVGAMGLMQVMPQTALYTAQKTGIRHLHAQELLNAEHNVRVGSHYLHYLLQNFGGNRILAAAAYNAGPHRVQRWRSEAGREKPVDVWIETIPFRETRHYVQNVLSFSVIYAYRLGRPAVFLTETEAKQSL